MTKGERQRTAAFVFGVVAIVVVMIVAIIYSRPTPFSYFVFRVVLSLAAAGIAAMIPGIFQIQGRWLKAGGALAVFIVVYFLNPASLVAPSGPADPSLTDAAISSFRTRVLEHAQNFRNAPELAAENAVGKSDLDDLMALAANDSRYPEQLTRETAILYRLYAAITLFATPVGADLSDRVRHAYAYAAVSFQLDPGLWASPLESGSLQFFKTFSDPKRPDPRVEDFLLHGLSLAMISADESEVLPHVRSIVETVSADPCIGRPQADLRYFRGRTVGPTGLTYDAALARLGAAIDEQLTLEGPALSPVSSSSCDTMVTYIVTGDREVTLTWQVDSTQERIAPVTAEAQTLTDHLIHGDSLRTIVRELLERASMVQRPPKPFGSEP